jgi:hypothetical protein
LGEARLPTVDT